ncbi:hypothetical protein M427DRAFT_51812 [Gonapodya prolifera JEL478]|uniref:DUF1750-domain-containing protein n=1 Tax=Gonapodya prolifera (strain JEL478) TaxID=1344416 RepID=A0A139AVV0_GONPJ|nr:hypothetical protein M427DRAFT_51812 [Gonapodya prolifera JEL478]|eukprot:KXS20862.1 hypothetical protein M427DRAFT_51812 [Gonapodya prolifera JEL478]
MTDESQPWRTQFHTIAATSFKSPSFLTTDKYASMLEKALEMYTESDYSWAIVSKPEPSHLFFFHVPDAAASAPLPPDGYGWLDEDVFRERKSAPGGREIEVHERICGFDTGDSNVTISRRRFRLFGGNKPEINAMHYVKYEGPLTPIATSTIKVHPSNRMNPYRYPNVATAVPGRPVASQAAPKYTQMPKHPPSLQLFGAHVKKSQMEDNADVAGDDMDQLTIRDIALERYMRNHSYIAEVLSPFQSITPPSTVPKVFDEQTQAKFAQDITQAKQEIESAELSHKTTVEEFRDGSTKLWNALEKLEQIDSLEDLNAMISDYEAENRVRIAAVQYSTVPTH